MRGINSKLSSLYNNSFGFNCSIIVFTETWLVENVLNSEIFCDKYQIYRRDRGFNIRGGGVLIAVSTHLSSQLLLHDSNMDIEFIAVIIKLSYRNILISSSYIPPHSSEIVYRQHAEAIKFVINNSNLNDTVISVGDFNMPSISWNFSSDDGFFIPSMLSMTLHHMEFIHSLLDLNLYQVNGIINNNLKLLDLVFVNDCSDITVHRRDAMSLPEDSHHPTLEINISNLKSTVANTKSKTKTFRFNKTNYNFLNELLSNTNWTNILLPYTKISCAKDIDNLIDIFYKKIYSYMEQCIPKIVESNRSGPPWGSKHLSSLKNKKNKLYKIYKKSGLHIDFAKYSSARAKYNLLNQSCYYEYLNRIRTNLSSDPKSFYKFVNSKRRSVSFPPVMKLDCVESDDDLTNSNLFADFFATTYSDKQYDETSSYPILDLSNLDISIAPLDETTVFNYLNKLKFSYKCGPDGIPSSLLIKCAAAFTSPLTYIFNISIIYGFFPTYWKDSFIIPLFKSGCKRNIENYRGIAKLSSLPKLFEKIITDQLSHQVSSILSPAQHGFTKGCSTITNLLNLTTIINRGFVQQKQTDVIYTDFSKAFDKVNHKLLLKKLNFMGFTHNSLRWISSYLSNRKQKVYFKKQTSKPIYVKSGVPQGSHLGPLLFSLFINDLPRVIKYSNILMYADDVKIFLTYNCYADHTFLQHDLDAFSSWCKINLMELNYKKCNSMCFFRRSHLNVNYVLNGHILNKVDAVSDLGILLDAKLNFIQHISLTVNKARSVLGFIKRWAKEFNDPYVTKQLYTSLVRPILEYGSIIWDPTYNVHINTVESVQKQFLLFCLRGLHWNTQNLPSYNSRLALIKLPTLKSRRTMLNVTFVLNLIKGNVSSQFLLSNICFNVPSRPTRNFLPLSIQVYRANYANWDPLIRIFSDFNKYYKFVDYSQSLNSVKIKIILFLNN